MNTKKIEKDKTKIEHLTKLKDMALQFQFDDDMGEVIAPGQRGLSIGDPEEDIIIITYPKGHLAITKRAYEILGAPEALEICVRGDNTCLKPRTNSPSSCPITNAEGYDNDRLYRFSNTSYLRKINVFDKDRRYYFYGVKTKEGWIIFDHTMPFHEVVSAR